MQCTIPRGMLRHLAFVSTNAAEGPWQQLAPGCAHLSRSRSCCCRPSSRALGTTRAKSSTGVSSLRAAGCAQASRDAGAMGARASVADSAPARAAARRRCSSGGCWAAGGGSGGGASPSCACRHACTAVERRVGSARDAEEGCRQLPLRAPGEVSCCSMAGAVAGSLAGATVAIARCGWAHRVQWAFEQACILADVVPAQQAHHQGWWVFRLGETPEQQQGKFRTERQRLQRDWRAQPFPS